MAVVMLEEGETETETVDAAIVFEVRRVAAAEPEA